MRRGAAPDKVAAALVPDGGAFSRGELAAIAVARSLARIPCELTAAERAELVDDFGERHAEWVVLGAVMMGFLNKFMDAVGVELEQPAVAEISETIGAEWSPAKAGALLDPAAPSRPPPPVDGLRTKLRLLPLLPAAIRTDRKWQRGVPSGWPDAGAFVCERTGHDFPVLERLHSNRVRRAITPVLKTNLDPTSSVVGIGTKVVAGAVFAEIIADGHLAEDIRALARHAGIGADRLAKTTAFARGDDAAVPEDHPAGAALILARAASYSPARVDSTTIAACSQSADLLHIRGGVTPCPIRSPDPVQTYGHPRCRRPSGGDPDR